METIRFYRKEPNKEPGHSRYRIGINEGPLGYYHQDGTFSLEGEDYYTLFVEGEEHLGSVYFGTLSSILKKYDIVEEQLIQGAGNETSRANTERETAQFYGRPLL